MSKPKTTSLRASGNPVSLRMVAHQTRLSIPTVSRILRGQGNVLPATRERVLEAARQLGYRPNLLVRGIQTGRTGNIGVLLPFADEYFMRIFSGIHEVLLEQGNMPLLCRCRTDGKGGYIGKTELELIHALVDRRVDGVILMPVQDAASDEYLHEVWDRGIPLVAVDRELAHSRADFVGTDDEAGGRLAAETLLKAGHRRLAHIAGPAFTSTGRLRRTGFENTVRAAGATCISVESKDFREIPSGMASLFSSAAPPTGVFCGNDLLAVALFPIARALGLAIPDQISVIGFGDLSEGNSQWPALTSIDQNPEQVGRLAAQLLLQRLANEIEGDAPRKIRLSPELRSRDSVAAAPPRPTRLLHGNTQSGKAR